MSDAEQHEGRCLCGAVRYAVSGPLRPVLDCHCERCRRFTGHHMAATSAARSDVTIEDPSAGADLVPGPGGRVRVLPHLRRVRCSGGPRRRRTPSRSVPGRSSRRPGCSTVRGVVGVAGERLLHPAGPARARHGVESSAACRRFSCVRAARGRPGDDQVVGVLDQAAHHVVLDRPVEVDGVPVPLVLVVAGPDPGVRRPQLERSRRVALEVDDRVVIERAPGRTSCRRPCITATSSPNG